MSNQHKHQWEVYLLNAWGYFSKREDDEVNDRFWTRGSVSVCRINNCPEVLFSPNCRDYSEVECVAISFSETEKESAA